MTRTLGSIILLLGVIAAIYGAIAFFVFTGWPPNDVYNGRLPSLYLLFAAMAAMLVGAAIRGLKRSSKS